MIDIIAEIDIFAIQMTYLNALLPILLSFYFSSRSEAFLASYWFDFALS